MNTSHKASLTVELIEAIYAEPTRSILFRSAASLALQLHNFHDAVRLINAGLTGNPPPEIRDELTDLLAKAQKSMAETGQKSTTMHTTNDAEEKKRKAFSAIYLKFFRRIWKAATTFTGDRRLGLEVAIDVFEEVYRDYETVVMHPELRNYLYSITSVKCRTVLSGMLENKKALKPAAVAQPSPKLRFIAQVLKQLTPVLPEGHRTIFHLTIQGVPIPAIARQLGLSVEKIEQLFMEALLHHPG